MFFLLLIKTDYLQCIYIWHVLFMFYLILFVFPGFVPITRESKLIAVKGPVPCQISLNSETTTLPVAFTSSATHFKPIILQQNTDITKLVYTQVKIETSFIPFDLPVLTKYFVCFQRDTCIHF